MPGASTRRAAECSALYLAAVCLDFIESCVSRVDSVTNVRGREYDR